MAEIIARFADGRLFVRESRLAQTDAYTSGKGLPVRIGHVKTVEQVISVDAYVSGNPGNLGMVFTPLKEVTTSGDTIHVIMRRADQPHFLSGYTSGAHAYGVLSGITSGRGYLEELGSGLLLSGRMTILANVIGF